MRLQIEFELPGKNQLLPFNYQYPLSSWIYKVIARGNDEFAGFLHDKGYSTGEGKTFKLFTFSGLRFPKNTTGKSREYPAYLAVRSGKAWLDVSFFLPEQLEPFVSGLFREQDAEIGDKQFCLRMKVSNVQLLPEPVFEENKMYSFRTKTAVVLGEDVTDAEHEQYILPLKPSYKPLMINSILDKCRSVNLHDVAESDIDFAIDKLKTKTSLQTIKSGTQAETKVRGYYYDFTLKAPAEVLKLIYAAGIGSMNSLGFGMGEIKIL